MILLLGIACLTWTLFELARLCETAPTPLGPLSATGSPASRPNASAPGRKRFRAWDESGRSIQVDDLGARPGR